MSSNPLYRGLPPASQDGPFSVYWLVLASNAKLTDSNIRCRQPQS
jgi:hypothetical protein